MFPTYGGRLLASPPGEAAIRQKCAVRPDRSGHVAHHAGGTLTSANRRSLGHGPGDQCKAIHVVEFGAGRFISWGSERDDSTAWNHLTGSEVEPLPVMAGSPCAGRGPTRAPDSGDDTSLRVIAPAPHHWIYKRTGRGAVEKESHRRSCSSFLVCRSRVVVVPESFKHRSCPSFLSSFLLAHSVCLGIAKLLIRLLAPPCFTN